MRSVEHVAFLPLIISDGSQEWYGLGPVSVLPKYQKQGIGKSLINRGLSMLKELGGQGCALVGDPNYYNQFGFKNFPEFIYEGVPQEVSLALPSNDKIPQGSVEFHKAFLAKDEYLISRMVIYLYYIAIRIYMGIVTNIGSRESAHICDNYSFLSNMI